MKIRWLRITGIGPFAGAHTIDFSAFDDSGLFLLEGPTGAGKSTLIDAITFALYGDVARTKDASKDRLRSNHILDSAPSEADLVFEVASGIYRVTRTPAYTPAGKKSQRNSRSTLTRVVEDPDAPDGWRTVEPIASGPRDVGYEIPAIVGLDKDQFLQTIVLPQGKFSQFLTATSDAREQILRDIFDTQIYSDFARALTDAASSSRRDVEDRRAIALGALDHMRSLRASLVEEGAASAAGCEEEAGDAPVETARGAGASGEALDAGAQDPAPVVCWARSACEDAAARHERAAARAREAAQAARDAGAAFERGRALADEQEERARLVARLEELAVAEPGIRADALRAAQARRALAVAPLASSRDTAARRLEAACDQVVALAGAVAGGQVAPLDPGALTSGDVALVGERARRAQEEATRTLGALETALEVEASLPGLRADVDSLEQRHRSRLESIADLEAQREALPGAIKAATASLAAMRADADALPERRAELRSLGQRLDSSRQADLLRAALIGASEELRDATARAKLANAAAADGHDLWIAQTASALASELEEDTPCPVCGSPHHPSPAPARDGDITREQVAALDRARDEAETALRDARAAHADMVRRIEELNEAAGGPTPLLENQRDEAAALVARLEALRPQISDLEEALAQVRAQLEGIAGEEARARQEAAALSSTLEERRSALAQANERVEAERAGFDSLQERASQLGSDASRAASVARACADWEAAREAEDEAGRAFEKALEDQGLDAASWRSLLLPETEVEACEERAAAHERDSFAARQALASPRLALAAAADAPDLVALAESSRRREEESARCARVAGRLEQHSAQLVAARDGLERALGDLARARASAGPIRRLADIAAASGPENLASTPLAAWVLIARLEEVLAAANPRLERISSGRYQLVAVPDDGTSSRKSGLGLAIVDHDTEAVRSPRTLSGGETFYTSLALALGLADVVSAEAGGVELRTMFIDEGFGSLDSHTLALVMEQLQALRCAGRTVGVISHVEEMATQIADQIQVRPLEEGGSTLRVRA